MRRQYFVNSVGLIGILLLGMTGCGVWPTMTEDHGRRPFAMGKSDQVLSPWAPQPVHLNEEYGNSYRYALEGQILNPQAGNSLEPVEGIGGQPSQFSMERYHKSFEKPPFAEKKGNGGGRIKFSLGGGN